jgi:hypothetical protein
MTRDEQALAVFRNALRRISAIEMEPRPNDRGAGSISHRVKLEIMALNHRMPAFLAGLALWMNTPQEDEGAGQPTGDVAPHLGVAGAIQLLQRTIGVEIDGILGQETVRALQHHAPRNLAPICTYELHWTP